MKKRILSFILLVVFVITLVGCIDARATTPYTPQSDHEQALILATQKAETAVVAVVSGSGHGSGVIFKKEDKGSGKSLYYVLTNYHVIEDQDEITIHYAVRNKVGDDLRPSSEGFAAQDAQSTPSYDIAVVRFLAPSDLQVTILPIVANDQTRLELVKMQTVIAIGSPYNWETYFNYATSGEISQFNYAYNNVEGLSIKHSAPINPGNSGGALINLEGNLIGINVSKIATIATKTGNIAASGLGHALNINVIGPRVSNYKESGYEIFERKPRLGITVVNMDVFKDPDNGFDTTKIPNMNQGIVVVGVDSTRGAYEKIQVFDVIIKANNQSVTDTLSLSQVLGQMAFGQTHTITVLRMVDGTQTEITVSITII